MTIGSYFLSIRFLVIISLFDRFAVCLVIEIIEEIVEEDRVRKSEDDGPTRVAAFVEQELSGVEEGNAELELEGEKMNVKMVSSVTLKLK